jgi:hypothetical protein
MQMFVVRPAGLDALVHQMHGIYRAIFFGKKDLRLILRKPYPVNQKFVGAGRASPTVTDIGHV